MNRCSLGCAYLTRGLAQLDSATPGPNRDRRETAFRMERGFLTSAAEGYQSSAAAADFEQCLRLGGNLTDGELFSMLIALGNYYLVRADLRRAAQVIKSLREGSEEQRRRHVDWYVYVRVLAMRREVLGTLCSHLRQARSVLAGTTGTRSGATLN
jgi:hypothetical protein